MLRSRYFLEHKNFVHKQKTQTLQLLRKHGYSVRDCGVDYFAVNQKLEKGLELGLLPAGDELEVQS